MTTLLLVAGFISLLIGGEALVRGAVRMGRLAGLTPVVVGMVIVGFGTSSPELFVSVQSSLAGAGNIALGNVVGSNITNVLLILGLAALVAPIARPQFFFRSDALILASASLGVLLLSYLGELGRLEGIALLILLGMFIVGQVDRCYRYPDRVEVEPLEEDVQGKVERTLSNFALAFGLIAVGFFALWLGADWLVTASVDIARQFNVSDTLIGITIIAIGTSLPELSSVVIAALRSHSGVAYGSIVGSNIFNLLGIVGAAAATAPLTPERSFQMIDGPIMVIVAVIMIAATATGKGLSRIEGSVMILLYIGYMAMRVAIDAPAGGPA